MKHFHDIINPKIPSLSKEKQTAGEIAEEFKQQLKQIYEWRLQFVRDRLGGHLLLEYMSWDYLGGFDELHMNYTSKETNAYWFQKGYTLGYFSFSGGNKKVAPMIVAEGVLQGKVRNPVMVKVDGKEYPIFYYENDTHKNNEYLYADYIEHGVAPNMVTDDIYCDFLKEVVLPAINGPLDNLHIDPSNIVGCLVDDKCKCHWTVRIHDLLEKYGIHHILCPCTKVGQPNDFGINGWIRKKVLNYVSDWLTDRSIRASHGELVPPLTEKLLMSKHQVPLSITYRMRMIFLLAGLSSVVFITLFYARTIRNLSSVWCIWIYIRIQLREFIDA